MKKENPIPLFDLHKFIYGTNNERLLFIKRLGNTFSTVGFIRLKNHGIPTVKVQLFYKNSEEVFSLPVDTKMKYYMPDLFGQRGYTKIGVEKAVNAKAADLKEFFQIGRALQKNDPLYNHLDYAENVNVEEVPEFLINGKFIYDKFQEAGTHLLRAVALYLKLDECYFDEPIAKGLSIQRAIHYPPITKEPKFEVRAEKHRDINLITLLIGASAGGLQLLKKGRNRDSNNPYDWFDAIPEDNEIIVNVSDMLQRLTNNRLRSVTHRVVNPPREEWHIPRLSIPFFLHPISSMDLTCLASCVSVENPAQYEPITAGDYLHERLEEIGLKK